MRVQHVSIMTQNKDKKYSCLPSVYNKVDHFSGILTKLVNEKLVGSKVALKASIVWCLF